MALQLGANQHTIAIMDVLMAVLLPKLPFNMHVILDGEEGLRARGRR